MGTDRHSRRSSRQIIVMCDQHKPPEPAPREPQESRKRAPSDASFGSERRAGPHHAGPARQKSCNGLLARCL